MGKGRGSETKVSCFEFTGEPITVTGFSESWNWKDLTHSLTRSFHKPLLSTTCVQALCRGRKQSLPGCPPHVGAFSAETKSTAKAAHWVDRHCVRGDGELRPWLAPGTPDESGGGGLGLPSQKAEMGHQPLVPPVPAPDQSWPWEPLESYLREREGSPSDSCEDHTSLRCVDKVPQGQASLRGGPAPAALLLALPGRVALELALSPPLEQRRTIKG